MGERYKEFCEHSVFECTTVLFGTINDRQSLLTDMLWSMRRMRFVTSLYSTWTLV